MAKRIEIVDEEIKIEKGKQNDGKMRFNPFEPHPNRPVFNFKFNQNPEQQEQQEQQEQ